MGESVSDPKLIAIMGDIHANATWTFPAVKHICERLSGESPKIILQAGDFGVWAEKQTWFSGRAVPEISEGFPPDDLSRLLEDNDAEIWFCEGNHEDHDLLERHAAGSGELVRIQIAPRITWLR